MSRRALVCSYGPPQPDRDSGSRRLLDHLEFLLEAGWLVDFVSNTGLREARYVDALRQQNIGVFAREDMEALLVHGAYDIALFSFWQNAEQHLPLVRRLSPATRVVVDSVDMQLLRDARRLLGAHDDLLAPDYAHEAIGELNVYAAADHVLTVSEKEAELIGEFLARPDAATAIPDNEDMVRSTVPFSERDGMLFVGSFAHPPNLQALEWLCVEVLPQLDAELLERHPLSIVGAGLSEMAESYVRRIPNAQLIGWVPSVTPYLERARVSLVPLRYGAGTKRKLLQSLMLGTPAVATTIGIEGMPVVDGEHVLVADEPTAFARAIERLLVDEELWQRLSVAGHERIATVHGRPAVRARFIRALEAVLARPAKAPRLPEPAPWIYSQRLRYQENQKIIPYIREQVAAVVPETERVLVLADGCDELLRAHGSAVHVPSDEWGRWLGHFGSGAEAVECVAAAVGGEPAYLLLPATNFWMLDLWPELRDLLGGVPESLATEHCVLYAFNSPARVQLAVHEPVAPLRAGDEPARLIAFFLPQFHPIPENDAWWGHGFTEWTNVTRAAPLFPGHHQPNLPSDLGFYDLRMPEVRQKQAELARSAGIHAFCYYHYWFGGKQLLERPFEDVLASGEPDFPFCLCWANEPWSRRWDGSEHDVLQPQTYSAEDDVAHIRALLPALADPRAVTVDGKPLFIVYQGHELPEPERTTETWRREVERAGLPGLHLLCIETGWDAGWDATEVGFDAKVLFMPQFSILAAAPQIEVESSTLRVFDYEQAWPILADPPAVPYRRYPCVFPGWDNTPRRGRDGWVVHNATPEAYEAWLTRTIASVAHEPQEHRLVFLNAWNEWAEGAYLEPDQRHGRAYLEATHRALAANAGRRPADGRPPEALDDRLAQAASSSRPGGRRPRSRRIRG